jgi:hypothetical protein
MNFLAGSWFLVAVPGLETLYIGTLIDEGLLENLTKRQKCCGQSFKPRKIARSKAEILFSNL